MINSLTEYLLRYAFDHGIGYEIEPLKSDTPPRAVVDCKLIIVNSNWYKKEEIPFTIGHEIGHIMNGDTVFDCQSPIIYYPLERNADRFSVDLIFNYSLKCEDAIREPGVFIEQYGIPTRMLNYATEVFAKNRSLLLEA